MGKKKELKRTLNEQMAAKDQARDDANKLMDRARMLEGENEALRGNNTFLRKEGKAACSKIENLRTIID